MTSKKNKSTQEQLKWKTETRKVSELLEYEKNPRVIKDADFKQLMRSISEFDYIDLVQIDTDNTIIGGHQRIKAMKELGRGEEEIEVRVPNRPLTLQEFQSINIRLNKNQGEFDFAKMLDEFDSEMLLDVGFAPFQLGIYNDHLSSGTDVPDPDLDSDSEDDQGEEEAPESFANMEPESMGDEPEASGSKEAKDPSKLPARIEGLEASKWLRDLFYEELDRIKTKNNYKYIREAVDHFLKDKLEVKEEKKA